MSSALVRLQGRSLASSLSKLSAGHWSKQQTGRILHISHGQWIFSHTSLHNANQGYLHLQQRKDLLPTIDRLSQMSTEDLPNSSKHLLEMDVSSLNNNSLEQKSYWIYTVKAARHMYMLKSICEHSTSLSHCTCYDRTTATHLFSQQHRWHRGIVDWGVRALTHAVIRAPPLCNALQWQQRWLRTKRQLLTVSWIAFQQWFDVQVVFVVTLTFLTSCQLTIDEGSISYGPVTPCGLAMITVAIQKTSI